MSVVFPSAPNQNHTNTAVPGPAPTVHQNHTNTAVPGPAPTVHQNHTNTAVPDPAPTVHQNHTNTAVPDPAPTVHQNHTNTAVPGPAPTVHQNHTNTAVTKAQLLAQHLLYITPLKQQFHQLNPQFQTLLQPLLYSVHPHTNIRPVLTLSALITQYIGQAYAISRHYPPLRSVIG